MINRTYFCAYKTAPFNDGTVIESSFIIYHRTWLPQKTELYRQVIATARKLAGTEQIVITALNKL